jgi:hypothetical protein
MRERGLVRIDGIGSGTDRGQDTSRPRLTPRGAQLRSCSASKWAIVKLELAVLVFVVESR